MVDALGRVLRSSRALLIRWFCVFAAVFASGALGASLPSIGGRLSLFLLPSGFAVAAMCRWGFGMWPAVLLGGLGIDMWQQRPLLGSLGSGAGLAAASALTLWLLEQHGFDRTFSRGRDVPLFICAAAIGMVMGPSFAFLGYFLTGMTWSYDPVTWMRWWGNNTAGVLLVAPAFVAANAKSLLPVKERPLEVLVWLLGLVACCALIVLGPGAYARPIVALVALILMVVGTVRFGLVLSAFGAFVISLLTAFSFAFRIGAFGQLDELPGLVLVWTFVTALNFVYLSLTALLTQRDGAALARLQAEHRYAEIFEGSPQAIWVHQRRSLRFLMVNEAALRQYGWSLQEMLSMSVTALMPPGESLPEADEQTAAANSTEPLETRHVTRDRRILEVEVFSRSIDFAGEPAELVFAMNVTGRRAFGRSLIEAVAAEQRRIGQEMHDGLGQELTGLALSARALANRAARERDAIAEDLNQLAALATSCIQDARLIVQGLSPLTDADGNLDAALQALARRSSLSGTPVRFRARHDAPINIELKVRNHLYRIAQEAVQNALKHAGATAIDIELSYRTGSVRLEILDDGRGLPVDYPNGAGLGMRTMRFRASAIGARLIIGRRTDGTGNSVVCGLMQKGGAGHATEIAMRA
ncbi:MAG: histidine kinase [Steroidobacteraceae bacterium]